MRARPVSRAVYSPVSAPATGRHAYPPDALLYAWYGDGDTTELVANAFGSALAGTQYERQPDGSVVSVGTRMAMDYIPALGMRGLRTCGAVQNLLPGDMSQSRSVTLTAQAYTLQVFGAGSASCSYGTASVGSPLTFTATAGATVFTPSGASTWQLSATSYPVPYTPPGTTMTSSAGSATNGAYFSVPQNKPAWNALSGGAMTLAWRGVLGVGSADLPAGPVPVIGGTLVYGTPYFYQNTVRVYDNTNLASVTHTWSRNDHLILITQTNSSGTQFRVGYRNITLGQTTITWSSWANYDGSFNPDVRYQRLFMAFGNTYPMWHVCTALFPRQLADAEIIEAVKL